MDERLKFVARLFDGSKFKASNNPDKNFTKTTIKRKIDHAEQHIDDYFKELDKNDELEDAQDDGVLLKDKIEKMKEHLKRLKTIQQQVEESPDQQASHADPDCRAIKTGVMGRVVGYNVQTAADTKHHLIVAHEVTNARSDRAQLYPMGQKVQAALGKTDITVLADKGYYNGEAIVQAQNNAYSDPKFPPFLTALSARSGGCNFSFLKSPLLRPGTIQMPLSSGLDIGTKPYMLNRKYCILCDLNNKKSECNTAF